MPLHGRVPATIFPVMNGGWPYGHGGFRPQHPRQGISNPLDPDYRVPGAALGGDRNAPLAFVVHVATARNFLPCAGPLHPRLARSLREKSRRPRRSGWPSSPPSATSPGRRVALSSTFLKHCTRACTWYRSSYCPDYRALGDGGGAAGKPVPARPCPGHGFRRAVRTRLDRADGPWRIHPGGRRICSLDRKKGMPSQIGAPGPPRER